MTETTLTLTDFLLARIAEDEDRLIHEYDCDRFQVYDYGLRQGSCDCTATDRLLAECEAKRRIMGIATSNWEPETIERAIRLNQRGTTVLDEDGELEEVAEWTTTRLLRALAAVYADHPDYREEWRP